MKKTVLAVIAALPFVVFACGGGDTKVENPTNPTPSATDTGSAAASTTASAAASGTTSAAASSSAPAVVAWKDMTKDQKKEIMKNKVMPKMGDHFTAFDKKRYAEFSCKTCHGDAAKEGSFKMPNPKLPKLPTDPAGFKALSAKKPEVMKFMMEKVKPEMVSLLGVEAFEPGKNETGFGCYNCHEKADAAPAKK